MKNSGNISKQVLAEIHANNLTVVSQRTNKHRVVKVTNPQGVIGTLVMSLSPSQRGNVHHVLRDIQRTAQQMAA